MRSFEYTRVASVQEAPAAVGTEHSLQNGSRFLAGGTDLLTLMKADIVQPSTLVDIKRTADLPC
ncbi:MAG: FAD binding domain-containing protein, partial [Chloroflexota bacterium]